MTDRKLLEMAAKAAGNEVWTDVDGNLYTSMQDLLETPWNPLADDGDALRLAVMLGITPIQHKKDNVCAAYWTDIDCCSVGYKSDPYAATRCAIVRAAAEIGKNMK